VRTLNLQILRSLRKTRKKRDKSTIEKGKAIARDDDESREVKLITIGL
jgi:hypothetical protein